MRETLMRGKIVCLIVVLGLGSLAFSFLHTSPKKESKLKTPSVASSSETNRMVQPTEDSAKAETPAEATADASRVVQPVEAERSETVKSAGGEAKTDKTQDKSAVVIYSEKGVIKSVDGQERFPVKTNLDGSGVPNLPRLPSGINVKNPTVPTNELEVARIQSQINHIMRLNQTLKKHNRAQVTALQRIDEVSRYHQKMLEDLKRKNEDQAQTGVTEELLRQEKVRLIEEQAKENLDFVSSMSGTSESAATVESGNSDPSSKTP
ncbi:MAG: hypothetical protein NC930_01110 [Candidatus Omnitrophica bacterium]|nr:hypothetical protein [Candidatus Omnitrophota bacterium]